MPDIAIRTAALALAAAGFLAILNLMRVFVADWLASRRAPRHERRHPSAPCGESNQRRGSGAIAAAAAAALLTPGVAAAQADQQPPNQSEPSSLREDAAPALAPAAPSLVISTDRPSFSDGTGIVPFLRLNLETGYTFTYRDRDEVETQRHNGPEILARLGLIEDRFEVRFITSGYTWARTEDSDGHESVDGMSDVALGFKLKLIDQSGWVPRLALGAQSTVGGGHHDISSQKAEPTLKLIWSYDLGQAFDERWKGFTLGGNANIAWPTTNGDRFTQGQGSVYLAFPLADRLTGFAEYYLIGPNTKDSDPAHYIDFGGAYLIHDRIQLDARAGFGLNDEADNVFVGFGISFLF